VTRMLKQTAQAGIFPLAPPAKCQEDEVCCKAVANNLRIAFVLLAFAGALFAGYSARALAANRLYDEQFRPQFHFTPPRNWMNDPNGPVYYEGEYHLFYQYNPFGNEWGHMSWGHAISRDLVHWRNLPVAIPERNGVMIFSGSAVVDWQNSSGLCNGPPALDGSCLVAVYTGATSKRQTQNLAYSHDRGRTWTAYVGNPVINLRLANFRDPKVFWYNPSRKWIMVVALPQWHRVRFFRSVDLTHWTALSDFGPAGAVGGVWECPDFFELPVAGEPRQTRWVLSVNLNPGGVAGGSGDQYFVGRFNGTTFTNSNPRTQVLWADYGKDFYASTSFSDIPPSDGRRIWIGWLDNWEYAARLPTYPWRGAMSIPRVLRLKRFPAGIRLVQEPVAELKMLRGQHLRIENQSAEAVNRAFQARRFRGETLEIEAEVQPEDSEEFGFRVRKSAAEQTVVGVDPRKSQLFVDRTRSGEISFDPRFAGRQTAPLDVAGRLPVRLHIFVDWSSVEVFANGGEAVISGLIFPSPASQSIEFYSVGGPAKIVKLDVWKLRSAWQASARDSSRE
jgi:fructan beta-fructosidase